MLLNYLTVTVRNLLRNKIYALVNILGLSVGIASFILIMLFNQDEIAYDRFHQKGDRIFMITQEVDNRHLGSANAYLAPLIQANFPEVASVVRLRRNWNRSFNYQNKTDSENLFLYADANLFDVFSFTLLKGDPHTALTEPFSIVINETLAAKYFNQEDPIGEIVTVDDRPFRITGVLQNVPRRSHISFRALISMATLEQSRPLTDRAAWTDHSFFTYLHLADGATPEQIEQKFPAFIKKHGLSPADKKQVIHLHRFTDIYLATFIPYENPLGIRSSWVIVYIFSAVAFSVLLIACINFMNLATAQSAHRAREVGLRKVVGAHRGQLIGQFLSESLLYTTLSLGLAIALVEIMLPSFNAFLNAAAQSDWKQLTFDYLDHGPTLLGLLGLTIFAGLLSGSYPAFFLSAFQPAVVLKGAPTRGRTGRLVRKGLVVLQFACSAFLILFIFIISNQLAYLNNRSLGFDKKNMATMRMRDPDVRRQYGVIRNRLSAHPGIVNITASSGIPTKHFYNPRPFTGKGVQQACNYLRVDHTFFETYDMEFRAGRSFSKAMPSDASEAFILNETAVRAFGWATPADAIGQPFESRGRKGQIIGVVKDFHFSSLHFNVRPVVMWIGSPAGLGHISIKTAPAELNNVLNFAQKEWEQMLPGKPFSAHIHTDLIKEFYRPDTMLTHLMGVFSVIALFVACLGLFGLAAFTAEQRTKEIGVRKVLGASVSNIVTMLSKEFLGLVIVANLITWPIAYVLMDRFFHLLPYRTDIGADNFIWTGVLTLSIALITVGCHAIKAGTAEPVEALRCE